MADNDTRIRITAIDDATATLYSIKNAADGLTGSFTRFQGALAGLGVTAALGGLALTIKHAIDAAASMEELSQKTGIATQQLTALDYAMRREGVTTEAFGKGVKELSKNLVEAGDATSKAGKLFKLLGVESTSGTREALLKIADTFKTLPDGATKAALSVQLFGKAGMDLIPALNNGSAGIKKIEEEARRLGITFGSGVGKQAKEFNDNLFALQESTKGLGIAIAERTLPGLTRITEAMKDAAEQSGILKAAWVGLGGVAAEALGLNDSDLQKLQANLKRAQGEVDDLGSHLDPLRKKDLLSGVVSAGNMVESAFMKANFQLRLTQSTLDAMAGKFDDQVSRAARQGQGAPASGVKEGAFAAALRDSQPQVRQYSDELDRLRNKILGVTSGFETDFPKAIAVFNTALVAELSSDIGPLSQNSELFQGLIAHADLMQKLIEQQPAYLKGIGAEIEAARIRNDEVGREIEQDERLRLAREGLVKSIREEAEDLEFETTLIGKSNGEREAAIRLRQLEKAGIDTNSDSVHRLVVRIRDAVDAQERLRNELINQLSAWDELSDRGANFFVDLATNGREAFSNLRKSLNDFAREILALFAKRFILQIGAQLTGNNALSLAAGQVGQGTLAGSILSGGLSLAGGTAASGLANLGLGSASQFIGGATGAIAGRAVPGSALAAGQGLGAGLAAAGPYVAAALAIYAAWNAFKDKGENWTARLGFGAGAQAYTTQGVFGAEGFQQIAGNDAVNRSIQAFMASTRPLDQQLALHLTPEQIDRITSGLAAYNAPGARRADGQPAQFAFDKNDSTAPGQLTLEYLKQKYSVVFEQIDTQFAQFIHGYTGTSEDLVTAISQFAGILDNLDSIGIKGLNIETLRGFQRAGEDLGTAFSRVAEEWGQYQNLFLSDSEKVALVQQQLTSGFADLGIAIPANKEGFKKLVDGLDLSTEAGRTLFEGLMQLAPAFATVSDAAAGLLASFDSIMSQARPGYAAGLAQSSLDDAVQRFMALNPWTQGLSSAYVAGQIATITRSDFQNYSPESQAIINEILGYEQTLSTSAATFTTSLASAGSALSDYTSNLKAARDGLRDWTLSKLLGQDSALPPGDRLNLALTNYDQAVKSRNIGSFQSAADALLTQGRGFYASGEGYKEIFDRVIADAQKLGGFSLGINGPVASIDQMRSALVTELQLAREDNKALQRQVADLIATMRQTSSDQTKATRDAADAQTKATRDAADATARAVVNAVESVAR